MKKGKRKKKKIKIKKYSEMKETYDTKHTER